MRALVVLALIILPPLLLRSPAPTPALPDFVAGDPPRPVTVLRVDCGCPEAPECRCGCARPRD